MSSGDKEHSTRLADFGRVPNTARNKHGGAPVERNRLEPTWQLEQQSRRTREQVHELLPFWMHFPVGPVRGTFELGNEPSVTIAVELRLWHGPELFATRELYGRTTGGQMNIGFAGVKEHDRPPINVMMNRSMVEVSCALWSSRTCPSTDGGFVSFEVGGSLDLRKSLRLILSPSSSRHG
jgi:hypothetical protein